MGEVQNKERLESMLPIRRQVITNKDITLDLLIDNIIFTQQCFVLTITTPIILGSYFFDTHFAVLYIADCTIILNCTDYTLTNSLTMIL